MLDESSTGLPGASTARTDSSDSLGGGSYVKVVPLDAVIVPAHRLRALSDVTALAESIGTSGLLQPLVVDGSMRLLCGAHRLEACRKLGWREIPVLVRTIGGPRLLLAEVDENLCRRELSVLERAEHLSLRRKLWEQIARETPVAAPAPTEKGGKKVKRVKDAEPELEAFLTDTDRRTGRGKSLIKQELKIGELPEDVRALARETPVSHSKKELLALTKMQEPEQMAALERVKAGESKSVRTPKAKKPKEAVEGEEGTSPEGGNSLADVALSADIGPWITIATALSRARQALEQADATWPDDMNQVSDEDGDGGRMQLRNAMTEIKALLAAVRRRAAG